MKPSPITGSKDRLDQAKTIDLCQNPLTKEPKLSRARQIPEWSKYDGEIAGFARRLVKEGKIGSSALSAEVDALAGEKPKKGTGTADDSAAPVEGETTASSSPVHAEL
ncbi:hypothetical protein FRB91_002102 [Serendipita sp. 411]|nr:hypothetical protein FRB91_002102 [Serendipita sp. 411]